MRPSDKPTGEVWRLLAQWQEAEAAASKYGRGPTQGQMAQMFGVSTQLVSQWKVCESAVQTHSLQRIAMATGIPFDDLAQAAAADNARVLEHNAKRQTQVQVAARENPKRGPQGPRVQRGD